ncbi:MAG: acylneuraminate cytidylyltransferase family protein [Desulfobacterales bacterium]|nr:acylneuraminate cytidylyltransferase family protein [Desulfobacterales bacterium]
MLYNQKILGIIPARGGSKGILSKNLREMAGHPLISWVITKAKQSAYIDRLILSSEDQHIIETAKRYGIEIPFIRPQSLARDESTISEVILHALDVISGFDYVVCLQPTTPLVIPEDIDGCIQKCISNKAPACVTVTSPNKSPYWMCFLSANDQILPLLGQDYFKKRRQELPNVYIPNGAVYIAQCDWFFNNKSFYSHETIGYVMPNERSIDIDTEMDLVICEGILNGGMK